MPIYPLDLKGSGKIIMLADTNQDGIMDKRKSPSDYVLIELFAVKQIRDTQ